MPAVTREEYQQRRRNAAGKLVAGGALIGAGTLAQNEVKRRTGINSPLHLVRDASKQGLKPHHGKYAAGWLGTRGITATGVPLAMVGARNLLTRKPKPEDPLSIRSDVVDPMVNRTTGGVVGKKPVRKNAPVLLPRKEQQAQQHRKHKAANLATASAGIGVTALGLRAPAGVKWAAARSKRLAAMKPVQRVASWEHKATPASWNVGVLGTGVGSAAALNAARIQRTELRAEEGKVKKRSYPEHVDPKDFDAYDKRMGRKPREPVNPDSELGALFRHKSELRDADVRSRYSYLRGKGRVAKTPQWKQKPRAISLRHDEPAVRNEYGVRVIQEKGYRRWLSPREEREYEKSKRNTRVKKDARAQALMTGDWNNMSEDDFNHLARHLMRHGDYSGPVKGPLKPVKRRSTPVRYHASLDDYLAWNKKQNGRAKVRKDDMLRISGNRLRSEDVAKALIPRITPSTFRPRPIGFGGVRAGGIRRTPTGRLVTYRGSLG